MKDFLVIGSGQCGVTIAQQLLEKYGDEVTKKNKLYFNTNKDTNTPELIELKKGDSFDGSGRDIRVVLDTIIPPNVEAIKQAVESKLTPAIKNVVLINSLGGASGSSINYHIVKEILLPYKQQKNINIIICCVLPSQSEGIPATSNASYMIQQYYSFSSEVTIIPTENDKAYKVPGKGQSTFQATNEFILDNLYKVLDYTVFLGTPKENGYNTLDKAEYNRIIAPSEGFVVLSTISDNDIDKVDSLLSTFDINTAKKMVVMFRTAKGQFITLDKIQKLDTMFPNVVKITAESESPNRHNSIDIIANGVELPAAFSINVSMIMNRVNTLKEAKVKSKTKNKEALKEVKGSKLLNI